MGWKTLRMLVVLVIGLGLVMAPVAASSAADSKAAASAVEKRDVSPQKDESLRKGETRQTVDPSRYDHPTIKKAYEVAKEIPWVLDSIYCFCYCKENPYFKHISLLSCYVDDHAANWTICLREALRASELYKQGKSVAEIKETVEREFK